MHHLPVLKILLTPSLFSGIMSAAGACAVLGASTWSYISSSHLLYEYFFGPNGLETALVQSPDRTALLRQALSHPAAYYLLLLAAGVITGYTVYVAIEAIAQLRAESKALINSRQERREMLARFWARAVGLTSYVCYILFFVSILVPFSITLLRTGIDSFGLVWVTGLGYVAASFFVLGLGFHVHAVFWRLCLLKYRVFGGTSTLVEQEMRE